MSRTTFFRNNPSAAAWAALDEATNMQKKTTPGAITITKNKFKGKRAIILGSGVAGLTTAYELLAQESGLDVTILEASNRTGGRCLSLRTGDTLTEDKDSELFDSSPGETQVVRFKRPVGDSEPYLNAGPGRIPSGHKRLLSYLKKFGVDVEVYVMNSESNLVQMKDGPIGDQPVVYRRLDHNTRGWLSQMVYGNAEALVKEVANGKLDDDTLLERTCQLKSLMISFGELIPSGYDKGKYVPTAGQSGLENGRSRAGYDVLPGVGAGKTAPPLGMEDLLKSEFWEKTRFYQPSDFLWQATLFQPVGGMDQVQHAFAQQVASLGGTVHLNSPVKSVSWDPIAHEFLVLVSQVGTEECIEYRADYCFSNIAMPFLQKILSEELQGDDGLLNESFKQSLQAIYAAQFNPVDPPESSPSSEDPCACFDKPSPVVSGYKARFLANTTKVGWQADRTLWQGTAIEAQPDNNSDESILSVDKSEVGVVPIFGGISWTDDDIAQIWYPSTSYHDDKGILTGAYNFSQVAYKWGKLSVQQRLDLARDGARKFGQRFGDGLHDGLAIAWQNMPHIKGGWAQWHTVSEPEKHFNVLVQGSGINESAPVFFIVGDQVSSLPGWQEGAIASALNAISRMQRPDLEIPYLSTLPDTRLMVEGV